MDDDDGYTVVWGPFEMEGDTCFPMFPEPEMTGQNIHTSIYGLMLVALELSKTDQDNELFKMALDDVDCIEPDDLQDFFNGNYPPDLDYDSLKELASMVVNFEEAYEQEFDNE